MASLSETQSGICLYFSSVFVLLSKTTVVDINKSSLSSVFLMLFVIRRYAVILFQLKVFVMPLLVLTTGNGHNLAMGRFEPI